MTLRLLIIILAGACAHAQAVSDRALGLVTASDGAKLLRRGTELELTLRPGDLLFAGDRITLGQNPATVWFCPSSQILQLASQTLARVEEARLTPAVSSQPAPFCPVPPVTREELAKPAFLGQEVSRSRGIAATTDEAASLTPAARSAMEVELRTIQQAPGLDSAIRDTATAAVYSKYAMHQAAATALDRLKTTWTTVDWPRQLVHEQHELVARGTAATSTFAGAGQTYALLVGVSDYLKLPPEQKLLFADRDAELMQSYLQSARGGTVPAENIRLLRNQDATVAAIRNGIGEFLRARATENDTVILFLAAHGVAESNGAYIIGYDTDPDNLRDTAINMVEVQDLLEGGLAKVGQVMIFIDVCHAGAIGNIANTNLARVLNVIGRLKGEETFGLMASAPSEKSMESSRFGGGHGAFSYFLSRAMNGDADEDKDNRVTVNELQAYVYNMVRQATKNKQNPRATGDMPGERVVIPDVAKAGIEIAGWQQAEGAAQAQARGVSGPSFVLPAELTGPDVERFEKAVTEGRLLPPDTDNASDLLNTLRPVLLRNPLQLLLLETRLRTALQDRGQQVLLTYLRGDETPQRREDFEMAGRLFEAALSMDAEATAWQSRAWFSRARAMLFESRYQEALNLLERSARIEPDGPYIFNALGLLYLQQASFPQAISAFRDAIRLAPYWSYPRHNLALALTQTGAFDQARTVYRDAQKVAPRAWFIPYNLGLVEQRVNRWSEAKRVFQVAAAIAPGRPEPDTALGFIAAYQRHPGEAEMLYRRAITKQASFLPARHNLAVLLSESGRLPEALSLWELILQDDPGYQGSRLALASALDHSGRKEDALAQLREALRRDPELMTARLTEAQILTSLGRNDEAERNIRGILDQQPRSAAAWEALGSVLENQGKSGEARDAYQRAAGLASREQRRALERKMKQLGKRRA